MDEWEGQLVAGEVELENHQLVGGKEDTLLNTSHESECPIVTY